MSFDAWGKAESQDRERAKRLVASYVTASFVVAALLGAGVVFGGQIKREVEEVVNVKFAPPPPEPKAPAPPPAPPPPAVQKPKLKAKTEGPPPPLGPKIDAVPTELPKAKPLESDPANAVNAIELGQGDPNGCVGCTGKAGGGGGVPAIVDAGPPAPVRPYQVNEVTTPPTVRDKVMPAYPEDARKQGVDMVVVVKFVVTETGAVEDITFVRGHQTLDAAVREALAKWTFTPGTLDGKPVRVVRLLKFPFHLRTTH